MIFKTGDEIIIDFNFEEKKIIFQLSRTKSQIQIQNIEFPLQNDYYVPCLALCGTND